MSQENSLQYQDILSALKSHANSNVFSIFVPSLQKNLPFRQITVEEQKFISKRMVEDSNNKSNTYETFVALISRLCIDKNLKIQELTELDRIKILLELFRKNYSIDKYDIVCPHCDHSFVANIDFSPIIEQFNNFDSTGIECEIISESSNSVYKFKLTPPTIKRVREYNALCVANKTELDIEPFERSDFYKTFISQIDITPANEFEQQLVVKSEDFTFKQFDEIINNIPVEIIFSKTGILYMLVEKYLSKISSAQTNLECEKCGAAIEGAMNPSNFF